MVPHLDVEERATQLLHRHRWELELARGVPHGLPRVGTHRPARHLADARARVVEHPRDDEWRELAEVGEVAQPRQVGRPEEVEREERRGVGVDGRHGGGRCGGRGSRRRAECWSVVLRDGEGRLGRRDGFLDDGALRNREVPWRELRLLGVLHALRFARETIRRLERGCETEFIRFRRTSFSESARSKRDTNAGFGRCSGGRGRRGQLFRGTHNAVSGRRCSQSTICPR